MAVIIDNLLNDLYDFAKKEFGEIKDGYNANFGEPLKVYLERKYKSIKKIKTILHQQPQNLENIYYPLRVSYKQGDHVDSFKAVEVDKLFSDDFNAACLVGNAGSGKSTIIKKIFLNLLKSSNHIPFFIELRRINHEKINFEEYLISEISKSGINVSYEYMKKFLEYGKFYFFFDGFDEVSENKKETVLNSIRDFIEKNHNNKFIITTRPNSQIQNVNLFKIFFVENLSEQSIKPFIKKQLKRIIKDEEINYISERVYNKRYDIKSFLTNPLTLSLITKLACRKNAISIKKSTLYKEILMVLTNGHDEISKPQYTRELTSNLNIEQIEVILSVFSLFSYKEEVYEFDKSYMIDKLAVVKKLTGIEFDSEKLLKDLCNAVNILIFDDGFYTFIHRSIQEFFCAKYINTKSIDENKETYKKLLKDFIKHSNLINILYELDKGAILENVIIPIEKQILKELNDNSLKIFSDVELYFSTIKDPNININYDNIYVYTPSEVKISMASYGNTLSFHTNFFRFLEKMENKRIFHDPSVDFFFQGKNLEITFKNAQRISQKLKSVKNSKLVLQKGFILTELIKSNKDIINIFINNNKKNINQIKKLISKQKEEINTQKELMSIDL